MFGLSGSWKQGGKDALAIQKPVQLLSIHVGPPHPEPEAPPGSHKVVAVLSPGTPDVVSNGNSRQCQRHSQMGGSSQIWNVPRRSTCDIHFSRLSYSVKTGKKEEKTILKDIHGQVLSGQLTAILGPSGAGKSTLLNVLAGYKNSGVRGEILVNGKSRVRRDFRKRSCYIMQEDCLSSHLSVQELMMVAANLKLGARSCQECKKDVVADILGILGLRECCPQRISKLSGGQKKRVSIALELINNPPVMFFDEPTSGLDSNSCYQVITLLKLLASGGRTIICTIHQPSARIFEKFDWLYILAQGRCLYSGQPGSLIPFLQRHQLVCPEYHNPADYVMEVAVGEHGDHSARLVESVSNGSRAFLEDRKPLSAAAAANGLVRYSHRDENAMSTCFLLTEDAEEDAAANEGDFAAGFWTQFRVLFLRNFLSILRDRMLTGLRLVSHVFVSLLIGLLYWQIGNDASKVVSNAGFLFFSLLFLLFTAMLPTILTFPFERTVFRREHLNHWYSLKSYYLAKTVADLPFQVAFPILYLVVVYFMTQQPLDAVRFFMVLSMCVMTSLVSQSVGLVIGSASSSEIAIFLGPIISIPLLLFSGFFVTFDTIPPFMRWFTYVSYVRYAYEGTMLAIYGYDRPHLDCHNIFCLFTNPEDFLSELDIVDATFYVDLLALVVMFLALRVLGYFVLRWKLRQQS